MWSLLNFPTHVNGRKNTTKPCLVVIERNDAIEQALADYTSRNSEKVETVKKSAKKSVKKVSEKIETVKKSDKKSVKKVSEKIETVKKSDKKRGISKRKKNSQKNVLDRKNIVLLRKKLSTLKKQTDQLVVADKLVLQSPVYTDTSNISVLFTPSQLPDAQPSTSQFFLSNSDESGNVASGYHSSIFQSKPSTKTETAPDPSIKQNVISDSVPLSSKADHAKVDSNEKTDSIDIKPDLASLHNTNTNVVDHLSSAIVKNLADDAVYVNTKARLIAHLLDHIKNPKTVVNSTANDTSIATSMTSTAKISSIVASTASSILQRAPSVVTTCVKSPQRPVTSSSLSFSTQ